MAFTIAQKLLASQLNDFNPSGDVNPGDDIALTSGGVITIANDTNLYRSAANVLTTDDDFKVAGSFSVPRGVIARGRRTTTGTNTTTAVQGYIRMTGISMTSGRLYRISVTGIQPQSSAADDDVGWDIRFTTDGSTPTTSSTVLPGSQGFMRLHTANSAEMTAMFPTYTPASNLTFGLILCYARVAGSGNVNLFATSPSECEIVVEDIGVDPGNSGTNI